MLLHYLAKLNTGKMYFFTLMFHVDLPIGTHVTSELLPITDRLLFIHETIGYVYQTRSR